MFTPTPEILIAIFLPVAGWVISVERRLTSMKRTISGDMKVIRDNQKELTDGIQALLLKLDVNLIRRR